MLLQCENLEEQPTYKHRFEHLPDYLYVEIYGKTKVLHKSQNTWARIAAECHAKAYQKVLIEECFEGQLASVDLYELALSLLQLGFNRIQIAFVDCMLDHYKLNLFGEVVAHNRGIKMKVFLSVREARNWLLS